MNPFVEDLTQKSLDDLLKTVNDLHKKAAWLGKMGNGAMVNQIRGVIFLYQEEINKRYRDEANAAKQNPIMKNSLDIG
jgi:hypothetical protein